LKGIGEGGSQFLQRRNLEEGVMSELQEVDLVLFHLLSISYFSFDLSFLFYFWHLGLGLMIAWVTWHKGRF